MKTTRREAANPVTRDYEREEEIARSAPTPSGGPFLLARTAEAQCGRCGHVVSHACRPSDAPPEWLAPPQPAGTSALGCGWCGTTVRHACPDAFATTGIRT